MCHLADASYPLTMSRSSKVLAALTLVVALGAAGCSDDSSTTATNDSTTTAASTPSDTCTTEGDITVSAAASLTESFTAIADDIEEECDGADITLTFDSSGKLSEQILSGAPVDVFASADEKNMDKVEDDQASTPEIFAKNNLVIVTKPGNPEGIKTLADLADAGIVALCAEDAPCGNFAGQALESANVSINESNVTRGENAKATLAAVAEGDAVAGIVYVTDALAAAESTDSVEIPESNNVIASYPIARINGPGSSELAQLFVDRVLGPEGQKHLKDAGFLAP